MALAGQIARINTTIVVAIGWVCCVSKTTSGRVSSKTLACKSSSRGVVTVTTCRRVTLASQVPGIDTSIVITVSWVCSVSKSAS